MEKRVYIIASDCKLVESVANIDEISDDDFIEEAEKEGLVYTLEGFVNEWNFDAMYCPTPDTTYMRII